MVVIGAGFTGLSTALHLRRANIDVTMLEAMEPGWGASGRNNGQVIPTLSRPDPDDIIARYGAAGERLVHLVRDSASILFDLVHAERLDIAEAEQTGWIQPVHSPGRMKIAERRFKQWSRFGAPVELLSRAEAARRLGSDAWFGGWWNRTGGHINPLGLVRGLVRTVLAKGGQIYARTPVVSYEHSGARWSIQTEHGPVSARALVLATNAYTGVVSRTLAPAIAREIVPVLSWQMATTPLGDNTRRAILPERSTMSDTHGELYFARYDARHRLVTGGALVNPANGAARLKPYVAERLRRLFPSIGDVQFDYVWNGYIGMTRDYLPRIHRLGPDGYAWAGCNGRAVALSIALGREFARAVQGTPDTDLALPFTQPAPIPLHGLARRVAPLMLLEMKRRDRREM